MCNTVVMVVKDTYFYGNGKNGDRDGKWNNGLGITLLLIVKGEGKYWGYTRWTAYIYVTKVNTKVTNREYQCQQCGSCIHTSLHSRTKQQWWPPLAWQTNVKIIKVEWVFFFVLQVLLILFTMSGRSTHDDNLEECVLIVRQWHAKREIKTVASIPKLWGFMSADGKEWIKYTVKGCPITLTLPKYCMYITHASTTGIPKYSITSFQASCSPLSKFKIR